MEDIGNGQTVTHVACVGLSIVYRIASKRLGLCLGVHT